MTALKSLTVIHRDRASPLFTHFQIMQSYLSCFLFAVFHNQFLSLLANKYKVLSTKTLEKACQVAIGSALAPRFLLVMTKISILDHCTLAG